MKTSISSTLVKSHPNLDAILWRTACIAKEKDHDIITTGLFVRAIKSKSAYWTGMASPYEESVMYGTTYTHPSGRIDLRLTAGMVDRSIVVLFAHELRHIGQFHRGRKLYGIAGWDGTPEDEFEADCLIFEREIADLAMMGTRRHRGL